MLQINNVMKLSFITKLVYDFDKSLMPGVKPCHSIQSSHSSKSSQSRTASPIKQRDQIIQLVQLVQPMFQPIQPVQLEKEVKPVSLANQDQPVQPASPTNKSSQSCQSSQSNQQVQPFSQSRLLIQPIKNILLSQPVKIIHHASQATFIIKFNQSCQSSYCQNFLGFWPARTCYSSNCSISYQPHMEIVSDPACQNTNNDPAAGILSLVRFAFS